MVPYDLMALTLFGLTSCIAQPFLLYSETTATAPHGQSSPSQHYWCMILRQGDRKREMKVQKKEKQAYHSEAKDSEDLSSTTHFRAYSDEEHKSYILLRKGMDNNSKTELLC